MSRRRDAIFFDVGHTLIWFHPPVEEIARQALLAAGLEVSIEQLRVALYAIWRGEDQEAATRRFPASQEYDKAVQLERDRALLRALGNEDERALTLYRERTAELYRAPGALRLYDDVLPVLDQLRSAGYRLGVISNWSWNLRDRLRQVELHDYFEVVMASAYAGCQKPHPDIFLQALAQMGAPAERSVHVGDWYPADVVGARAAGMQPLLLDRAGAAEKFDCPVIRTLWELLDWLDAAD